MLIRFLISIIFLLGAITFKNNTPLSLIAYLVSYLIIGYDIILKSYKNILKGKVFDENFLMTIATLGAIILKEYPEAIMIMLMYQLGEYFQDKAEDKSIKSMESFMEINPDTAYKLSDNAFIKVPAKSVSVGNIIMVKPGNRIPLDGVITDGESYLNLSSITGEYAPQLVKKGDLVMSGAIVENSPIKVKVTKSYEKSTASVILDLIKNSCEYKTKEENFINKFSRIYTPLVVILALFVAIIPPIFFSISLKISIYRALSFLVVSCPCALVLSVPLAFVSALGTSSRNGVLIKGSNYISKLAKVDKIVFDKTGTLTYGKFSLTSIKVISCTEEELLEYAAYAEYYSPHPIALSIKEAYAKEIDESQITMHKEVPGSGVITKINQDTIYVGNIDLFKKYHLNYIPTDTLGTTLYVAKNKQFLGSLTISDTIKENAIDLINNLSELKINDIVMLSGDNQTVVDDVAKRLGIKENRANMLPQDKVSWIKNDAKNHLVCFVGDGMNDAPVIMESSVGIAMGGIGSDATRVASDIIIINDDIKKVSDTIKLSRKTMRIVYENIIISLGVKASVLILSTLGITGLWLSIFSDVGISLIAILNSLRLLKN